MPSPAETELAGRTASRAGGIEAAGPTGPDPAGGPMVPTLLDFYPLEERRFTELAEFFEHLRAGRFTTTRCPTEGRLLWPPRTVCPECHGSGLEWVDLPTRGRIYAFSAVLVGAPLGMESEVPFAVGLVDLEGVPLRLFGRIEGRAWGELAIGDEVEVVPLDLPDGRIFYRFRAVGPSIPPTGPPG
ncbi:MAG: Zn-ribbon domain-containing OB-fold protein [Thermoplasmata archaeon]